MLQIGDCVQIKARTGGPDVHQRHAGCRLLLWGQRGVVVDVAPLLNRPVLVAFSDAFVPATVRFWPGDLSKIGGKGPG